MTDEIKEKIKDKFINKYSMEIIKYIEDSQTEKELLIKIKDKEVKNEIKLFIKTNRN